MWRWVGLAVWYSDDNIVAQREYAREALAPLSADLRLPPLPSDDDADS
jgi:hypothetical protein